VVLLVLWMPASSHALLESAGWIHEEEHHHDDSSNERHHDAADGICRLASTNIHVPQPEFDRGPLLSWGNLSIAALLFEASLPVNNGPDPPGVAPPELTCTWQFVFRASLPIRAPSLIS
jgi:hypothetical protein